MSIKTYKPTTPSRRHMSVSGFDGIDKKAKISCGKKNVAAYKKLFTPKTGYEKTMKLTKQVSVAIIKSIENVC